MQVHHFRKQQSAGGEIERHVQVATASLEGNVHGLGQFRPSFIFTYSPTRIEAG